MSFFNCPGHYGHIDLSLPVYHPLLFPILIKLLRATCLSCHHLKLPSALVRGGRGRGGEAGERDSWCAPRCGGWRDGGWIKREAWEGTE